MLIKFNFSERQTTEKNGRGRLVNFFHTGVYKNLLKMILRIVYVWKCAGVWKKLLKLLS